MADNFLAKLLDRRATADPALHEAQTELQRLVAERPALREPTLWIQHVLSELRPPTEAAGPALSPERAREKLAAGIPLLRGESLILDTKGFRRRWRRACAALPSQPDDDRAQRLARAMQRRQLDPQQLLAATIAGRPEQIHEQAAALELDPSLTATLVRLTLFPLFVAIQQQLAPLAKSHPWPRGYCPICGSWPVLGEFRGLDQNRYLRCGLCASAWKIPRLFCPYCETRDHEQLTSFHRAGEENQVRVSCCGACRRYIKMFVTLGALSSPQLWVADVSTLHLDLVAAERGFFQ